MHRIFKNDSVVFLPTLPFQMQLRQRIIKSLQRLINHLMNATSRLPFIQIFIMNIRMNSVI